MIKNKHEPIIGAQYSWQGMPCVLVGILKPSFTHHDYDVLVEYFDKETKKWSQVRTPWVWGCFELVFQPAVCA